MSFARHVLGVMALMAAACGPSSTLQPGGGDGDGNPAPDASTCVEVQAQAEGTERPVDIILIVDSTGSMGAAIARVEQVINQHFAAVLDAAGVDYQVILLASTVTIEGPLATSGRLHTLDVEIGSANSVAFVPVLDRYAEWSGSLRPSAAKAVLHFTDANDLDQGSEIVGYAGTFDAELMRIDPAQFGTAEAPNLVYHAFLGLAANSPASDPWLPAQAVVTADCSHPDFLDAPHAGAGFQQIALRTGGLRFPICEFDHFDVVFQRVADDVISQAQLACSYDLPAPPEGTMLDLATIAVRFSAAGRAAETFEQVADVSACGPDKFYVDGDTLTLCPATCSKVRAAASAQIDLAFGCGTQIE